MCLCSPTKQYKLVQAIGWEGNRTSGVALALVMRHRLSGISTTGSMAWEREMSLSSIQSITASLLVMLHVGGMLLLSENMKLAGRRYVPRSDVMQMCTKLMYTLLWYYSDCIRAYRYTWFRNVSSRHFLNAQTKVYNFSAKYKHLYLYTVRICTSACALETTTLCYSEECLKPGFH